MILLVVIRVFDLSGNAQGLADLLEHLRRSVEVTLALVIVEGLLQAAAVLLCVRSNRDAVVVQLPALRVERAQEPLQFAGCIRKSSAAAPVLDWIIGGAQLTEGVFGVKGLASEIL